jgi:sugar phosphate permease
MFIYNRFRILLISIYFISVVIFIIVSITKRDFNKLLWKIFLCALGGFIIYDPRILIQFMSVTFNFITDILQGSLEGSDDILLPQKSPLIDNTSGGMMEL